MCPFSMATDGGIYFIRYTVMLVHVEKWTLFMDWSKVLRIGIKIVVCYHCASSGLVPASRASSDAGCGWIAGWYGFLVRPTCQIPDVFDLVSSNTVMPYFTTLIRVPDQDFLFAIILWYVAKSLFRL